MILSFFVSLGFLIVVVMENRDMNELHKLSVLEKDIKDLNIEMLTLRKHEKDFLARKDVIYLEKFKKTIENVDITAKEFKNELIHFGLDTKAADNFNKIIHEYNTLFQEVVKLQQTIGLNQTDGLYGSLRSSVHKVQEYAKKSNDKNLLSLVYELRKQEKDFMLRGDKQYLNEFNTQIEQLNENNKYNNILNLLTSYKNDFNKLAEFEEKKGLNSNLGLMGKMRKTIHTSEETLSNITKIVEQKIENKTAEIKIFAISFSAIIALVVIFLLLYVSKNISSAVKSGVDVAFKIGEGSQEEEVLLTGSSEMVALGESLEKMKNKMYGETALLIKEGENLNKAIIDASYDSVISISSEGDILSYNKTTQDIFFYNQDELLNTNINRIIKSSTFPDINSFIQEQSEDTNLRGEELIGVRKDNSNYPIFMSISQTKNKDETLFIAYIKDISEQKKYEEELQEKNLNLRSQNWLKEKISAVMGLTQGATNLREMSNSIISLLCKTIEAGHGALYITENEKTLDLYGSFAFQKRKNVSGKIEIGEGLVGQCAKEEKAILLTKVPSDYIQISSSLGEKEPFNITVFPLLFEKTLIGVIELASFKEFTSQQLELLEQVTLSLGITINNINNNARTQLLLEETQRQSEELQSQQEELQASNENLEEQTQQLQNSESILKAQREELTNSNEQLAEKSKSLESQKAQIELSRKDLEIKTEDLALASKYKSEFLANMSHELRTPLNSYLLLSKSLLENKKGNLNEDQLEDIKIIYEGGGELLHLINDIMDLSKVEAGKLNTHIEDVDPKTVCVNITNLFKVNAKNKNILFKAYCEENTPSIIETDAQRLEQILKNFLSNSFKFTTLGSIELKVHQPDETIEYISKVLHHKNVLAFSVIDTGIGISKDKQKEIFEAFQQEDGSTSRKYGGTGLGLAISKELAKKLGGEIHLESTKDKGSIFTLYLPVINNQSSGEEESEKSEKMNKKTNEKVENLEENIKPSCEESFISDDRQNIKEGENTILIIDDDKVFAKILLNIVRNHGYKALVAGDGKSGLYLALEYNPNGIILDLGLPDMDGNKVLEQLKFHNTTKDIPVHIISGRDDDQDLLQSGAISYLLKPARKVDIELIISKIDKAQYSENLSALIVDNDSKSQKTIEKLLKNENIQTKSVNKGKLLIKQLHSEVFDFVILDIDLPDISGFEVLEEITNDDTVILPHIIIYTKQELSTQQRHQLQKYSATVIRKDSEATDKQLDEALLFLQSMNTKKIPEDKKDAKKTVYSLGEEKSLLTKRKILLVDDDMRNTFALSKHLQETGLIVYEADNGQTALSKLSEQKGIELILMDIMMPVMDGYEAMRSIRKMDEYKDIPIIALTAKAMPQDRVKCIEAGASDYLTKPVNFEKLLSMLKVWLFKK